MHAGLHDGAVEQVALEVEEPGLVLQRLGVGADHVGVAAPARPSQFSPMVLPFTVSAPVVDLAALHQLVDHGRHAAGAVILLAQVLARRLQVDEQRDGVADLLPVVVVELDADVAGDGVEVDRRVGGAADGGVDDDDVLERLARHDLRRAAGPPTPCRRCAGRSRRRSGRAPCAGRGWRRSPAATCRAPRPASSWSRPCPWCCSGRARAPRRPPAR